VEWPLTISPSTADFSPGRTRISARRRGFHRYIPLLIIFDDAGGFRLQTEQTGNGRWRPLPARARAFQAEPRLIRAMMVTADSK